MSVMGIHPRITIDDPHLSHALREIGRLYGVKADVEARAESLHKFGHNPVVGSTSTAYTLWKTGADDDHETYVADAVNSIDRISCAAAATQTVVVEGHTSATDNHGVTGKTFVSQEVTLNGTTKVVLATPLNRVQRAFNSGTTDLGGAVYIYEDTDIVTGKPSNTAKIHLTIDESNQSEKGSFSIAKNEILIGTDVHLGVLKKTTAVAEVALQVREQGKVFRTRMVFAVNQGGIEYDFVPYLIFPANADLRLVAVASTTSVDVAGTIFGYYADIV
jgi:hypothetical protein